MKSIQPMFAYIIRYDWLILLLIFPCIIFPSPKNTFLLLIPPLFWFVGFLFGKKPVIPTPLNLPLLLLTIMLFISVMATYNICLSLPKIHGVIWGIEMYLIVVRTGYSSYRKWLLVFTTFTLIGLSVSSLALSGTHWAAGKFPILSEIIALLPRENLFGLPGAQFGFHPNEVAGTILWLIPPTFFSMLYFFFNRKYMPQQLKQYVPFIFLVLFLIFVLEGFILLISYSRSAYLGLFLAIAAILFLKLPGWSRWVIVSILILISVTGIVFYVLSPGGFDELITNFFLFPFSSISWAGRVELWQHAIQAIKDFPITGIGMNTFRTVVFKLYPLTLVTSDFDIGHAHNEFLQTALDLGIPGFVAFILINIITIVISIKTIKIIHEQPGLLEFMSHETGVGFWSYTFMGLFAGFLAHFFWSFIDAIALGAKPGFVFWMLEGLILSLSMLIKSKEQLIKNPPQNQTGES